MLIYESDALILKILPQFLDQYDIDLKGKSILLNETLLSDDEDESEIKVVYLDEKISNLKITGTLKYEYFWKIFKYFAFT